MSKLGVILTGKCPRCHEGNLYQAQNPYTIGKMTAMNEHCSNCGLKFEKEPGYFYGAMYISYALNIALFVTALVGYLLFFSEKIESLPYMLLYLGVTIFLFPVIFRLSRSIWINIMVKYQPQVRGEY